MSELSPIGPVSRSREIAVAIAFALLVGGIGGGLFVKLRGSSTAHATEAAKAPAAPVEPRAAPTPAPAAPREPSLLEKAGLSRVAIIMSGPLERSIVAAAGRPVGLALTQVVVRALVWWVNVPGDFRKGDTIDVLYEPRAGEEPLVHAVRFTSEKMGRTLRAYRFRPAGARFARFYQPDGNELEQRIADADAPLDDYEQVTSLLRDGRGHKGVDFKTPAGTPVKATFDGTITRRTWNFKMNGNSLEVHEDGDRRRTAVFLHLSELPAESHPGARVKRGQVIAQSGNSGHSYAPHLHYQLGAPGHPLLDPFTSHGTTRRALAADQKNTFDAEVRRLDALLDAGRAGT